MRALTQRAPAVRVFVLLSMLVGSPIASGQPFLFHETTSSAHLAEMSQLFLDIQCGPSDITICALDVFLGSEDKIGSPEIVDIRVYSRSGTSIGAEQSIAGWTLAYMEDGAKIVAGGPNTRKTLVLQNPIPIVGGSTKGISIWVNRAAPKPGEYGRLLGQANGGFDLGSVYHVGTDLSVAVGRFTVAAGPDFVFPPGIHSDDFGARFAGTFHYVLGFTNCDDNLILPTSTVGPTLHDDVGGSGPFKAGCVTVIQGNSLGQATVPPGKTLTVEPGAIVKVMPGVRVQIQGQTEINGSLWTSYRDDSLGGDTNGDMGMTQPAPSDWGGVRFEPSSSGLVSYSSFSYAGAGGLFGPSAPTMFFNGTDDVSMLGCSFTNNANVGGFIVDLGGNAVPPSFTGVYFADNLGRPIGNIPFGAIGAFSDFAATNNSEGDFMHALAQPTIPCLGPPRDVTSDVTIGPSTYPGSALVVEGRVCVSNGASLNLMAGTVLKFDPTPLRSGIEIEPAAGLNLLGESNNVVTLTSLKDDSVGGDTNGDGPSTGTPGDWEGIKVVDGVTQPVSGLITKARSSYSGKGNSPAMEINATNVTIDGLNVEQSGGDGLLLVLAQRAINLAAIGNAGIGVSVGGSNTSHDVAFVSARGNGAAGISASNTWTGNLLNANAWDNVGTNIDVTQINPQQVKFSNGMDPALGNPGDGNMNVDPKWKGPTGVQLAPTSPLVDTGLYLLPIGGQPARMFDVDGASGVIGSKPDIGASETATTQLEVAGKLVGGEVLSVTLNPTSPTFANFVAISFDPNPVVVPGLGTLVGGIDFSKYIFLGPFVGPVTVPLAVPQISCFSYGDIPVSVQGIGAEGAGPFQASNGFTTLLGDSTPLPTLCQ